MSLTAHPYVVLAEQQWKQESLGGAGLARPRRPRHPGSHRPRLPWRWDRSKAHHVVRPA